MTGAERRRSSGRQRRRTTRALAAALSTVCAALLPLAIAPAAHAADDQWWYDFYSVDAIHAEGLDGAGAKIAVVDSQINPDLPVFAGADLTVSPQALCVGQEPATSEVNDNSRHGSTVTSLLIGNGQGAAGIRGIVPRASVTFYGYGNTDHSAEENQCEVPPDIAAEGLSSWGWAVQRAVADGARIITTSVGASDEPGDTAVIAEALEAGVIILAATPNNTKDYVLLPWSYRGVVAVSAMDAEGKLQTDSTYGVTMKAEPTTVTAAGVSFSSLGAPGGTWDDSNSTTGSSLATPLVAGMLALVAQKYPAATPNQLLQSLILNTGPDDHPLQRDTVNGYGYGYASPNHMLRNDPTQYEDANPLLDKLGFARPSDAEFAQAEADLASAAPTPDADSDAATSSDAGAGIRTPLIIGGVAAAVVVLAGAVLTIVLITRNNKKNQPRSSS